MHLPTDKIAHTTAFVTPVVEHWLERKIARWLHPMKDRSEDPSHHERTLLPRSYISLWRETADQRPVEFTVLKIVNLTLIICRDHIVSCSLLDLLTHIHTLSFSMWRGVCYPVCGMMHIKEPLLLIGKSSLCGGSGFPLTI